MTLADYGHVAMIVAAVALVLLVVIVPIAAPRKIAKVIRVLIEIRDLLAEIKALLTANLKPETGAREPRRGESSGQKA